MLYKAKADPSIRMIDYQVHVLCTDSVETYQGSALGDPI